MRLDNKLKIAAFDTAMKSLLKNKNKYPDRTARNILESGAAVFHRKMPAPAASCSRKDGL